MVYDNTVKTKESNYNLTNISSKIYIARPNDSRHIVLALNEATMYEIPFVKYQIKETDMRIKTATFTTPMHIDLTKSSCFVKIVSNSHENFCGYVLKNDYKENSDGTYSYQCQDMSRQYVLDIETIVKSNPDSIYENLQVYMAFNYIWDIKKVSSELKKKFAPIWAGLRPKSQYHASKWDYPKKNYNPMNYKPKILIRNKNNMEVIRDLVYGNMKYVDVYFDENGVLQLKPFKVKEWMETGLYLSTKEICERQFTFDTTNAIDAVKVYNSDGSKFGTSFNSTQLTGLPLAAYFGNIQTSIGSPNQGSTSSSSSTGKSSSGGSKSKSTSNNSNSAIITIGKHGSPYNDRYKNIIVSADSGSRDFRSKIIYRLKRDGWKVTDLGTGPGTHSRSYDRLNRGISVNLTIYNGVDPKTLDETVTGWLKGRHEKYGVRHVDMFDSRSWTSKTGKYNKKGMWYYRHGDFRGYRVPKAWDDNYSGAKSGVIIKDLDSWYRAYYNKQTYCCGTTPQEAYDQFCAGGYYNYHGIDVNGKKK